MFNIEMIGKPAVSGPNTAWITGFERSSFGPLLQEAVAGTQYEFYPDPYPAQGLFYRSDNATLARLGVPAHSISTTPIDVDRDYHQVSDHVETLDREFLDDPERCEYFVPIRWLQTVPLEEAVQEIGMFGNQNTVCRPKTPKWRSTIERLKDKFPNFDQAVPNTPLQQPSGTHRVGVSESETPAASG